MSRFLTIMEVSQKQAYIFSSNKLKDNIACSAEIANITGVSYMQEAINKYADRGINLQDHVVYSGGGHIILEFPDKDTAVTAVKCITLKTMRDFPEIELFARTCAYDETKTPGENIKDLTAALEKKKSLRISSFHQGTFGIEKTDLNTGKPERKEDKNKPEFKPVEQDIPGFSRTSKFEDLGGSKGDVNFIAVVHIDGNAMGKRVETLASKYGSGEWERYKEDMRRFSEGIAKDFRDAYDAVEKKLAEVICPDGDKEGSILKALDIKKSDDDGKTILPIRRIISEGDDICFVSEGRIGLECAAMFLENLSGKQNPVDGNPYSACAGVAFVHRKYPFYRAYELAEELCSNAKKYGVTLGTLIAGPDKGVSLGAEISAIDWHIEYGEIQDSLSDTREQYDAKDGTRMELRPYIVKGPEEVIAKEPVRDFAAFRRLMKKMLKDEDFYGSGVLKGLRPVLKMGETEAEYYLKIHKIEDLGRDAYHGVYHETNISDIRIGSGIGLERRVYADTQDGKRRSLLFDAIEMMDLYLPLTEVAE